MGFDLRSMRSGAIVRLAPRLGSGQIVQASGWLVPAQREQFGASDALGQSRTFERLLWPHQFGFPQIDGGRWTIPE